MGSHLLLLFSFVFFIVLYFLLLLIYSTYFKRKDHVLKKMLEEIVVFGNENNSSKGFVLEKSIVALCLVCVVPLSAIAILCILLFPSLTFGRYCFFGLSFIFFTLGTLAVFGDYFLSTLVIDGKWIYIRCLKTLFQPRVIEMDGSQEYEEIKTGPFMLYVKHYFASIRIGSSSFIIMNIKNKKKLRDVFESMKAV